MRGSVQPGKDIIFTVGRLYGCTLAAIVRTTWAQELLHTCRYLGRSGLGALCRCGAARCSRLVRKGGCCSVYDRLPSLWLSPEAAQAPRSGLGQLRLDGAAGGARRAGLALRARASD